MTTGKAIEIEKRPGADWLVYYVDMVDGRRASMTIFGAATVEDALAEAKAGFSAFGDASEIEIVAVVRDGVDLSLHGRR